jgi:hypothetical protein
MPKHKLQDGQKRSKIIKLALTDSEYQEQLEFAKVSRKPLAIYCRNKVLYRKVAIVPEVNWEVWSQLSRPLGNLSKITELLYQAKYKGQTIPARLLEVLEKELLEIRQFRASIVSELPKESHVSELPEESHDS